MSIALQIKTSLAVGSAIGCAIWCIPVKKIFLLVNAFIIAFGCSLEFGQQLKVEFDC